MILLSHILYFLVVGFLLAREVVPAKLWVVVATVLLVVHSFWFPVWVSVILWLLWVVVLVLVFNKDLRYQYVSQPILNAMKKVLPPLSDTEQEAIQAGTVWWEAELFAGKPQWNVLFDAPLPTFNEAEQVFLSETTETLCGLFNEWEANRNRKDLSPEAWDYIKKEQFFGMMIPKEYGGLGFSEHAHAAVVTKVSTASVAGAVTVMVPNSLGPGKLILHYGTQEQKDYYLPRLARSEEIPCFALTGPSAGSDAAAIPDTGVVCKEMFEGEETLGLRLNWDKRYITLAPVATLLGLAFYVYDPDSLLGDTQDLGLTCALVPTETEGVKIGRRHDPLEVPFQNGPTQGKDVFIPLDWVIGGQENIGKGWKMLMESLAVGRGISLPALGNAIGQMSVVTSVAYTNVRQQFNLPIGKFGGVAEVLTEMGSLSYAMDSLSKLITTSLALGERPAVLSAMVKYFNTESGRTVMSHNMDIHAGKGIMCGPRNYLADRLKGLPISITVEGANILTRSLMIFGQGAFRCHPYLQHIVASLHQDDVEAFDGLFFGYMRHVIKNKARVWVYGLSNGYLSPVDAQSAVVKKYMRKINVLSAVFATVVDASFALLGGAIKREEILTGQFVDAWLGLTVSSAVLKKYVAEGEHTQELPLVEWTCQQQLHQSYQAIESAIANLPYAWASVILRSVLWPVARPKLPDAKLTALVSGVVLQDKLVRDRMAAWCFYPTDKANPIAVLLAAFDKMPALFVLQKKVKQAGVKQQPLESLREYLLRLVQEDVLSQEEADEWQEAAQLQEAACAVDDFETLKNTEEE